MDRKQEEGGGISVQGRLIDNLRFADDIDLIRRDHGRLQNQLQALHESGNKKGWGWTCQQQLSSCLNTVYLIALLRQFATAARHGVNMNSAIDSIQFDYMELHNKFSRSLRSITVDEVYNDFSSSTVSNERTSRRLHLVGYRYRCLQAITSGFSLHETIVMDHTNCHRQRGR